MTFFRSTGNDLDSIRALFSEKEKELTLAVAKVEALTQQLEDLRKDRRCPINLNSNAKNGSGNDSSNRANGANNQQTAPSPAVRELEKLRRELVVSHSSFYHFIEININQ